MNRGIESLPIAETPIAVLDFETTGFSPKSGARVVEVAIVRAEPGEDPRLVLDTLIDPQSSVLCSHIHGIEDADVVGAPTFTDSAGAVAYAMRGAVLTTFNCAFDVPFLEHESRYATQRGEGTAPPHMCMMYMRPLLGIGPRVGLEVALQAEGYPAPLHRAAHDAIATAMLWTTYRDRALARGARTFGDLGQLKRYKFMTSWERPLFSDENAASFGPATSLRPLMPRVAPITYPIAGGLDLPSQLRTLEASHARAQRRQSYRRALFDATEDGVIDDREVVELLAWQRELEITPGEVRSVHAAFFADALQLAYADHFVSHDETARLTRLAEALRRLGWAPGDRSKPA